MTATSVTRAIVTPPSALRQQRMDIQLRQLEFQALLHRKLDLERLFECLMSEGQCFVAFDGLQFLAGTRGADVFLGESCRHQQRFELRLGDRLLGDIVLMRGRTFTPREEREAERLVESLVYPLDNALEHHAVAMRAMTDAVTGLRNQQALDRELPREIRLAYRIEEPLAMLVISVDYPESISEHHGSDVAVQVWKTVAAAIASRLRTSDLMFRTSHDAFCLVLHQTGLDGAVALAERLRAQVDRCVSYDNVQFVLTASTGVTELEPEDNAASLIARAEAALALARQEGRNRIRSLRSEVVDEAGGSDDPTVA
ncbi:MAG: hypothetical protein CSB44_02065 [Gammaproteobacteria bacterium]|nr:MAG: hypothetical protein CSB44_02065 [Gammaproteobacteria bacterium]PIE37140.1 MAG: hypothetical protein CSA54_02045 [Gammaproteobacteria bacterium]